MSPRKPAKDSPARRPPLESAELRDIVRSYVVRQIRSLTEGHTALFEQALGLYALVEEELHADGGDAGERLRSLKGHPLYRTVHALLYGRARQVLEVSIRLMEDNRRIMARLERRAREDSITSRERADEAYREILVAEVPLERSLANIEAIAQSCELLSELLRTRSLVARMLTREAYAFVRRVVVRRGRVRDEMDRLWAMLKANPQELAALAEGIRSHGPEVLGRIYGEA